MPKINLLNIMSNTEELDKKVASSDNIDSPNIATESSDLGIGDDINTNTADNMAIQTPVIEEGLVPSNENQENIVLEEGKITPETINAENETEQKSTKKIGIKKIQINSVMSNADTQNETTKEDTINNDRVQNDNITKDDNAIIEQTSEKTISTDIQAPENTNIAAGQEEKTKEVGELFGNYESDFQKKEPEILEKISQIKHKTFKMPGPHTHFFALGVFVILGGLGIGIMFYLNPNLSKPETYTASILNIQTNVQSLSSQVKTTALTTLARVKNISTGENKLNTPAVETTINTPAVEATANPPVATETTINTETQSGSTENNVSPGIDNTTGTPNPALEWLQHGITVKGMNIQIAEKMENGEKVFQYKGQNYNSYDALEKDASIDAEVMKTKILEKLLIQKFYK